MSTTTRSKKDSHAAGLTVSRPTISICGPDGENSDDWTAWARHLARRDRPVAPAKLVPGCRMSPLAWALDDELTDGRTARLIERLGGVEGCTSDSRDDITREEVESWLAEAAARDVSPGLGLECLAWCHAMAPLAERLPAGLWRDVLDRLVAAAMDAAGIDLAEHPLAHQLLSGELPLTLAYLFPENGRCAALAGQARRSLSRGPIELLDGEGLIESRNLPLLRPLLACWTRAELLGRRMPKGCFNKKARLQYEWLVRQAVRLSRRDGTQVLTGGSAGAWCRDLFAAALAVSDDPDDSAAAAAVLPDGKSLARGRAAGALPEPAVNSEWAAVAMLRPDWSPKGPRLTVAHGDRLFCSELETAGRVLWSGPCNPEIEVAGEPLRPAGDWEQTCWFSDDDVDYLELSISLAGGWEIQRHVLLARRDRFLLIADALLGKKPAQIRYRSRLPISDDVAFEAAKETCEGYLVDVFGRRRRAAVLPPALPEWRDEAHGGALTMTEAGLELTRQVTASRLFAPLWIDLAPRRMDKPLTWRRLTVGENLEAQAADVAVGYRVQVGKRQWLVYRSLAPRAARTVLGQHLSTEFLVARFKRSGGVEELLEIE